MASDGDSGFAPGDIAKKEFPTSFRGYDQDLVRDYLRRLSFFLKQQNSDPAAAGTSGTSGDSAVEAENQKLAQQVERLERRLRADGADPDDPVRFEVVGDAASRILETARSEAQNMIRRAEERAGALEERSVSQAQVVQKEAEQLLAEKQVEANALVSKITDDAKRQAARLIADGENKHKRSVAESKRILAEAQDRADFERSSSESEAQEIVKEAGKRREDILTDLVERRREGHHQLNQLASARSGLVRSLSTTNAELNDLLKALSEKIELIPSTSSVKTVQSTLDDVDALVADLDRDRPKRRTGSDYTADKKPVTDFESADSNLGADGETDFYLGDDTELVELQLEDLSELSNFDSNEMLVIADLVEDSSDEEASKPDRSEDHRVENALEQGASAVGVDVDIDLDEDAATQPIESASVVSGGTAKNKRSSAGNQPRSGNGTKVAEVGGATAELELTDLKEPSPFSADSEVDEDLSKEIPLMFYTDEAAQAERGDTTLDGEYKGQLAGEFIARDVAITRFGPALRRRLRRALNDDQSDVLNRLRGGGQGRLSKVTPNDLPSLEEQLNIYVKPLEEGLDDLAAAGLAAGNGTTLPTDALHHLSLQVAKHMVQNLRTPSVELVEGSVDGDCEALHEPIRDLYRSVRTNALDAVIEDAINEAFSLGLFASIKQNATLVWKLDPRCEPTPLCEINAATPGIVKGDTFPSGHTRPLAMPGCRCLVLPADVS